MTTVRPLSVAPPRRGLALGNLMLAIAVAVGSSTPLSAQSPPKHWLHADSLPPGAIGAQRLLRGGPLFGYTQPLELHAPEGITLSVMSGAGYTTPHADRLLVGGQIGPVYRFRAVGVPGFPGVEVFPSVELIDRLYPPPGKANEFPVPIELTTDDLRLAAEGAFVTKVVYVEDPRTALPLNEENGQQRFDASPGDDPLVLAGELGRPIAIVRIGSRDAGPCGPDERFATPIELHATAATY